MDLRRERERKNHFIGIFLIVTFLCVGAIAVIVASQLAVTPSAKIDLTQADASLTANIDARAVQTKAGLFSKIKEPNEPDQFSYEIKKELVFSDAFSEGEILLKNPAQNQYVMRLELVLEDAGTAILCTGYLLPGQMIKAAQLDETLCAGKYNAMANISAVDACSGQLAGTLKQPVTIVVKS